MRASSTAVTAAAVVTGAVVLATVTMFGLRGSGVVPTGDAGNSLSPPSTAPGARPAQPSVVTEQRRMFLEWWQIEEVGAPTEVLADFTDGDVLLITISGGEPGAHEEVRQCTNGVHDWFATCLNPFPVVFDDDGIAAFQYQLVDPGNCGANGSCLIAVGDQNGSAMTYGYTVFGAGAPPRPVVELIPAGPYAVGQRVVVEVSSLLPGMPITIWFCGDGCAPAVTGIADQVGRHSNEITIAERCDRCVVVVVAGVGESMTWVTLADGASASYERSRLLAGLAAAAALVLAAFLIVRRVDWRPPSEAATPEFDAP